MDSLFGLAALAVYIWGIVRLFQANHSVVAWIAIFVPFVFIAGYVMVPRPGSSAYIKADDSKKLQADLRYPIEALSYQKLLALLEAQRPKLPDPFPEIKFPDV